MPDNTEMLVKALRQRDQECRELGGDMVYLGPGDELVRQAADWIEAALALQSTAGATPPLDGKIAEIAERLKLYDDIEIEKAHEHFKRLFPATIWQQAEDIRHLLSIIAKGKRT